jgi:ribosomal protein L37AE/L43A
MKRGIDTVFYLWYIVCEVIKKMVTQVENRPKCPKCGSQNGYVRIKSGEFVCRECGTVSKNGK